MKNKVLIQLVVPELDVSFDVFIPVNELIWKVQKLLLKSVSDLCNLPVNDSLIYYLINKDSGRVYNNNEQVIQTDIRNGTEIVMISKLESHEF